MLLPIRIVMICILALNQFHFCGLTSHDVRPMYREGGQRRRLWRERVAAEQHCDSGAERCGLRRRRRERTRKEEERETGLDWREKEKRERERERKRRNNNKSATSL